jgi:pimeloyl-ACP methyl ester carboxylesterase
MPTPSAEGTMKTWEIVLAMTGALLVGVSASVIGRAELPHRDFVLTAGDCHVPVTTLEPPQTTVDTALLFHGLAADRRIMEPLGDYLASELGLRVYLFDLPGHGDNTDAFSFSRADHCAQLVVESLIRSGEIDPKRTILIGHSMGGAIAIRVADREPVAGTVALSPAPMPLPRRMPANLLVFSAQYDLPILKRAARTLGQAAGGERANSDDFRQSRAFHLEVTSFSDHTSLLTDPRVFRQAGDWIDGTLDRTRRSSRGPQQSYRYRNLAPLIGLLALLLLFPFCATAAVKFVSPLPTDSSAAGLRTPLLLTEGVVCALATVFVLTVCVPLSFVGLYTGDYLASQLLIAGVLLLALNWRSAKQALRLNLQALFVAVFLGFAVILGLGAWLNWQVADLWLNLPRWLRFAGLVPALAIFCFAEEVILGPVGKGRRRALRFAVCLAFRAELWLACLLSYYALASGQVLILILVAALALFSILERLAIDALRLRTGSATAAAVFGAILAAWFIAAVFPLT